MGDVRRLVLECVAGANNPTNAREVRVTVIFASSGRATIATVGAPFAGTATGSCIARAAREAEVDPFAQSTYRVVYPFAL